VSFLDTFRKAVIPTVLAPLPNAPITVPKVRPFEEVGATGLARQRGASSQLYEEWNRELSNPQKSRRIFREMRDNDATVGAVQFNVEMLLRGVCWSVEPASISPDDDQKAEFVDTCLNDMSHTWEDFISECLTMLVFGFSFFETVYKRRLGDNSDPSKRSKYNDGLIGWRKWAPRSQETITEWIWDDEGGIQAAIQWAPPDFRRIVIPIDKALLFRTTSLKNSPEGRSLYRSAYIPWYMKRRVQQLYAIGIERDMAGMPVMYVGPEIMNDPGKRREYQDIVANVRRDEQDGLLLPAAYDNAGNQMVKFELVASPGSRQININEALNFWNAEIARTVAADFILLGHDKTGSWALSSDKTDMFAHLLKALMDSIASVINRYAIPRLFALNGWQVENYPTLKPGDIETRDIESFSAALLRLAQAGMPLFPDPEIEGYVRQQMNLPEKVEVVAPAAAPAEGSDVPEEVAA
jgi:hypothetical protein